MTKIIVFDPCHDSRRVSDLPPNVTELIKVRDGIQTRFPTDFKVNASSHSALPPVNDQHLSDPKDLPHSQFSGSNLNAEKNGLFSFARTGDFSLQALSVDGLWKRRLAEHNTA